MNRSSDAVRRPDAKPLVLVVDGDQDARDMYTEYPTFSGFAPDEDHSRRRPDRPCAVTHSEGARRAGCDSFVTKPCLPDQLVLELCRILARSR